MAAVVTRLTPVGLTKNTRPRVFLKSVLQSGVGKPVVQLKRATIKFCETSEHSCFVRKFIENNVVDYSTKYPSVALYVVPETDLEPCVKVEYLNGRVENKSLEKLDNEDILELMDIYAQRSGIEIMELKKDFHTDYPSIQGQWHPFLNNKKYNITKKLDFSVKKYDAWDKIENPWEGCYRKSENSSAAKRVELDPEQKQKLPLGPYGPDLQPRY